jgi:hypothetical protein
MLVLGHSFRTQIAGAHVAVTAVLSPSGNTSAVGDSPYFIVAADAGYEIR